MLFPKDDWKEASPESQHVDSKKLAEALSYLQNNTGDEGIRETVIIRNGYMIWQGDNIDRVHYIASCTKSFASTVLGLLIEDGRCTLDSLAADFVSDLRKDYPEVTLRHFATMTSGYNSVGPHRYGEVDPLEGSYNYLIPGEPIFKPGEMFSYMDNAMRKFAHVLTMIAREKIDTFFKRRIADPIGMKNWNWEFHYSHDRYADGFEMVDSGAGIEISARDFARFGHLFLNRGNWDGRQLISEAWVDQVSAAQVPASLPRNLYSQRQRELDGCGIYSYNWWVNGVRSNGNRNFPGVPEGAFYASGYNDNRCFIIPDWNMVIIRMGTHKNALHDSDFWGVFLRRMSEALIA